MGSCFSVERGSQLQSHNNNNNNNNNNNPIRKGVTTRPKNLNKPEVPTTNTSNSGVRIPRDAKALPESHGSSDIHIFSYQEMILAINHFRPNQVLGEGGVGIVYKGVIDENVVPGYESTRVAVKELDSKSLQAVRECLAEVKYLGQLRHPNLVKLIGYCCEGVHQFLVYEYMASGSLEKHLFSRVSAPFTWSIRLKIALDVAKGLTFLHSAARPIIYRNLKTSNILLDEDFNAKLFDFGRATDLPIGDQRHVSTFVMGTCGYAATEYVMTGHLTARSDVYDFGVVLLEMLTARKVMDESRPSREHDLVEWARPLLIHHKEFILDFSMEGQYSTKILAKVCNLAYQCLSQNPRERPLMSQVVEIIEALEAHARSLEVDMFQSGSGNVTLIEVPKGVSAKPLEAQKPHESESERGSEVRSEARSDEQLNKLNKTEPLPTKDVDHCSPSFGNGDLNEYPVSTEVEDDFSNRREVQKKESVYFRIKTKDGKIPEDGFRWKQDLSEEVENSPYPRLYFGCPRQGCVAQKIVERDRDDPSYSRIEYKSVHKCSSNPPFVPSEYLERCLSYCLLFPPGYEFDRDSMVQLWIAEEAIDGEATERLEDKGHDCLDLLQSRGFIEGSGVQKGDRHLKYKVIEHSVSEHYANGKSLADDFLIIGKDGFSNISRTPQHLSLTAERFKCEIPELLRMGPRLRTLLLLGDSNYLVKQVPWEFFVSLNLLRTLVLSGTQVSALPYSVGNLDDLRYFDLSDTLIRELPGVLCNLVRLQTLKLRNCSRFDSLPKDMMKLINLRHLDLNILRLSSMPKWMGRLVNLQTFGFVVGTDEGCGIGELYELNNITGSFFISCLENVPNAKEAKKANLRSKSYITKLVLRWKQCINAEVEQEILECLLPHHNLAELKIQFFSGSALPSWIGDPSFTKLISITFFDCINCSFLPSIGNLQSLKFLKILGMNKLVDLDGLFCNDFQISSSHIFFPMLEELIIVTMSQLEKWTVLRAADFPCLHRLSIGNCPRLAHLPSLASLNSLKYLELHNCPQLDCLPDMSASLETLFIQDCYELDGLPDMPASFETLFIIDCPKLQEQCRKGEGRDWPKIAHVRSIDCS